MKAFRIGVIYLTDENIVALYLQRSEQAIDETSAKYSKYCETIAFNILRNTEDVQECVNDTFLRAWHAIPPAHPSCLSTFLGKITRNLSFDTFKKKKTQKRGNGCVDIALSELEECVPSTTSVEQAVEGNILTEAINAFLGKLRKQQRDVFVCRYWYMNTVSEIAANYGISESNVKVILLRTRNKLKIFLQEAGVAL